MVATACPSAVAHSLHAARSQTHRSTPHAFVAQKSPSVFLASHTFASIRRSLHCTRTMANSNPMGLTPPAAFEMKTIRFHRVGHSRFSSMSMVRSVRASIA